MDLLWEEAKVAIPWRDVIPRAIGLSLMLLCWYNFLKFFLVNVCGEPSPVPEKKRAWFLSFLISSISTPFGIFYAYKIWQEYPHWDSSIMLESDELSRTLVMVFVTYMLTDMLLGLYAYPSEFGVLQGWVHHIFYCGFLFHSLVRGYTVSFAYTLLMESSSILLSGGSIFKSLRNDMAFGFLFFLFRILYHGFLLYKIYTIPNPRVIIWPPVLGVWVLHWYWFSGWIKQQIKRRKRRTDMTDKIHSPSPVSNGVSHKKKD